jgi:hypothetical protein
MSHTAASVASPTPHSPGLSASRLSARQLAIVIAWGVLLWFVVALLIRIAPRVVFDRGVLTVLLFSTGLPNAWLTVWLTRRLASLSPHQLVPATAIACAAAMLCDGMALTWTTLYGPETKDLVPAAALLLWGVAHILIAAFVTARREGA